MNGTPLAIRPRRALATLVTTGAALTLFGTATPLAGAATHGSSHVVRAAVPAGHINHVLVIDFENEGFDATFGTNSPATYLNGTLRKKGELLQNYYATGHDSLDNYLAQVSGQAPTEDTQADCADNGFAFVNRLKPIKSILCSSPSANALMASCKVQYHKVVAYLLSKSTKFINTIDTTTRVSQ